MGTGDGGLEELKDEFNGGHIQYAFARVVDPNSGTSKFVLVNWVRAEPDLIYFLSNFFQQLYRPERGRQSVARALVRIMSAMSPSFSMSVNDIQRGAPS